MKDFLARHKLPVVAIAGFLVGWFIAGMVINQDLKDMSFNCESLIFIIKALLEQANKYNNLIGLAKGC